MGVLNPGELQDREKIRKNQHPPDQAVYNTHFYKDKYVKYRRSSFDPWNSWFEFQMETYVRDHLWYPNIKPGMVVIDAGAGWGSYALTAGILGAEVHAFEPDLRMLNDLIANVNENQLTEVTVSPFGLSDHTGTQDWEEIQGMQLIRLDDYPLTKLDYVKMDIEGQELAALQGAEQLILKYHPALLVEVHLMYDKQLIDKISTYLMKLVDGYRFDVYTYPNHIATVTCYFTCSK